MMGPGSYIPRDFLGVGSGHARSVISRTVSRDESVLAHLRELSTEELAAHSV
jgi:hypothetical protein